MKNSFRGLLIYTVILLGVVVGAYFAGQRLRLASVRSASSPPIHNQPAPRSPNLNKFATLDSEKKFLSDMLDGNWPSTVKSGPQKHDYVQAQLQLLNFSNKDIPGLIALLRDAPDVGDKQVLIYELLGRLAGIGDDTQKGDPALAIQMLDELKAASQRKKMLVLALTSLSSKEPRQALEIMAKLDTDAIAPIDYENIFNAMLLKDTQGTMTIAVELPAGPVRDHVFKGLVASLALGNPQAGLEWAANLPPSDAGVLNDMVLEVSIRNPQLAATFLDKMTDPVARTNAILSIGSGIAEGPNGNPAAAIAWLNRVATGNTYETALADIFTGLTEPSQKSDGKGNSTFSSFKQDPALAVSLLASVTDPSAREIAIASIADGWGSSNPPAALAWAGKLSSADASYLPLALNTIVSHWLASDANAAIAYAQNSSDSSIFLPIAPSLAQAMAKSNPQAALAWTQTLPDGSLKNQSLNNVLVSMSGTDLSTAWNYAIGLPVGESQNTVVTSIIASQSRKDPLQAAALLVQIPAGTTQLNATSTLAKTWISQDAQTFTIWLTGLPPGDMRDTAIVQLASSDQATKNPAGIREWVNTVSDPQTRAMLLQKLP